MFFLFNFSSFADIKDYPDYRKSYFIENKGQVTDQFANQRKDVLFSFSNKNFNIFLKKDGISYEFFKINSCKIPSYCSLKYSTQEKELPEFDLDIHRVDVADRKSVV